MACNYFVFRNYTVEPLFTAGKCLFSGYEEIDFPEKCNNFIWFYQLPVKYNIPLLTSETDYYLERLKFLLKKLPADCNLFCVTINDLFAFRTEQADNRLQSAIFNYNNELYNLSARDNRIKVLDINEFAIRYPVNELFDARHYYLSQMILNPKLGKPFSEWIFGKTEAFTVKVRKKCIVVDLDNTLWGGILGEDGPEGLKIGNGYPGNCYLDFQEMLLEFSKKGVILAVASKNNLSDVQNLFETRDDLKIKLSDFSAYRINWNDKPQNIIEIAKELNIGTDSIVFIDDNPAERSMVKKMLPQVAVPDFPSQPYKITQFARQVYNEYFTVYKLTDEDKSKKEQYLLNTLRKKEETLYSTKEDFLKALKLQITVSQANKITLPRVSQMTQKTNQFNLTTKRYSQSDIKRLMNNNYRIWHASVKDKFGDNGITALAIAEVKNENAFIDSFLLSCRILGKGIEKVFLTCILNELFNNGVKKVKALYIPTEKNVQTEMFYENTGFRVVSVDNNGQKLYEKELVSVIDFDKSIYNVVMLTD